VVVIVHNIHVIYKGKVKISQPSLSEIREKWPLGRDQDMSWCDRHTTSMMKLLWLQPMAPWVSAAAYIKLGTSSH